MTVKRYINGVSADEDALDGFTLCSVTLRAALDSVMGEYEANADASGEGTKSVVSEGEMPPRRNER